MAGHDRLARRGLLQGGRSGPRAAPALLLTLLLLTVLPAARDASWIAPAPARADQAAGPAGSYRVSRFPGRVVPLREDWAAVVRRARRGPPPANLARPRDAERIESAAGGEAASDPPRPWALGVARPASGSRPQPRTPNTEHRPLTAYGLQGFRGPRGGQPSPLPDLQFDTIGDTTFPAPDSGIAAGPEHLVSVVNSAIAFYRLDGTPAGLESLYWFFSPDRWLPTAARYDPYVSYDELARRFIVICTGFDPALRSSYCFVAVSATSDPTGVWHKYGFEIARGGAPPTEWGDHPCLGFDSQAITISFSMGAFTGGGTGNRTVILDKAAALGGAALAPVFLDDLTLAAAGHPGVEAAIMRPVEAEQHTGLSPGRILAADLVSGTGFVLYRIEDPLGAVRVTASFIPTDRFAYSARAPQPGGAPPLDTLGMWLHKTVLRDDILWTCHTVSSLGIYNGGRAEVKVYRISAAGALLGDYKISNPSLYFWHPAVMPDAFGNAVVVFAGGDGARFVSLYHANYWAPTNQFTAPALTRAGTAAFDPSIPDRRHRWGDYFDATLDIARGGTRVWVQGQLAASSATWKMHAARIPTARLTLLAPNGGEQWLAGSVRTIRWDAPGAGALQGRGTVDIDVSWDDGASFTRVASGVLTGATGSYAWRVTRPLASTARVRVVSSTVPQLRDESDGGFGIVAARHLRFAR